MSCLSQKWKGKIHVLLWIRTGPNMSAWICYHFSRNKNRLLQMFKRVPLWVILAIFSIKEFFNQLVLGKVLSGNSVYRTGTQIWFLPQGLYKLKSFFSINLLARHSFSFKQTNDNNFYGHQIKNILLNIFKGQKIK